MRQFILNPNGVYEHIDTIPANRAFLFGDGIFETMVYSEGEIRFWKDHFERLSAGIECLKIQPFTYPNIHLVNDLVKNLPGDQSTYRIRWNIYRSGIGKYSPTEKGHAEWLMLTDFQPAPKVKKEAYFCASIKIPPSPWANCKTLNALPYVMANQERMDRQMDEVILLDLNGCISEAGSSNLFWVKNGIFFTPSLENYCIAGVGRKQILQKLKETGKDCQVGSFHPKDLLNADQVFVSNIAGISYIEKIEGRQYDCQPIDEIDSIFEMP
ncbi:aminotransferase class IV [Cyclobacterium plantarum]|uniref:branched-chain-amino-acid transaminase n=1 Tax=Cyclobacterium plantarum TaxID=2716263 RepID=A0ABX0H6Z5_9BACT|nr:aminotransferase class IV [Cyclobacterium plantarum]NHE56133.1 aminotransferase class IV [Cyclobacterium plantarum]